MQNKNDLNFFDKNRTQAAPHHVIFRGRFLNSEGEVRWRQLLKFLAFLFARKEHQEDDGLMVKPRCSFVVWMLYNYCHLSVQIITGSKHLVKCWKEGCYVKQLHMSQKRTEYMQHNKRTHRQIFLSQVKQQIWIWYDLIMCTLNSHTMICQLSLHFKWTKLNLQQTITDNNTAVNFAIFFIPMP